MAYTEQKVKYSVLIGDTTSYVFPLVILFECQFIQVFFFSEKARKYLGLYLWYKNCKN